MEYYLPIKKITKLCHFQENICNCRCLCKEIQIQKDKHHLFFVWRIYTGPVLWRLNGGQRSTCAAIGLYYGEHIYGGIEDRQNGLCPVERGKSEHVKAVRSGLRQVACLLLGAMVMPGPCLHPAVAMVCVDTMAPVTTEGWEGRFAQSWPHTLLTVTLGRTGLAPHWLQHSRE